MTSKQGPTASRVGNIRASIGEAESSAASAASAAKAARAQALRSGRRTSLILFAGVLLMLAVSVYVLIASQWQLEGVVAADTGTNVFTARLVTLGLTGLVCALWLGHGLYLTARRVMP